MSAIGKRIHEAIVKAAAGDLENALIQVSIAIDASGKKKRPEIDKVGVRYREFIRDHESIIYFLIVGIKSTAKPVMSFRTRNGGEIDLAQAYYKSVRNGLLHDGKIGDKLRVVNGSIISYQDERISISTNILWALIIAVVCDPINADEKIEGIHTITLSTGATLNLHELWGNLNQVYELTGYNNV